MIVTKGLGRGAAGAIVASGLCLAAVVGGLGTSAVFHNQPIVETRPLSLATVRVFDDRDLTELIPIIVEIINGRR